MMRVETDLRGLRDFEKGVKKLSDGAWRREAARAVIDAGRKTETRVQRAVHGQMATRSYQFVSQSERGTPNQAELAFRIWTPVGGQRIEMYRGLRSVKSGRLASPDAGGVSSAVWNSPRTFKRSFATGAGFFATLPGGKSKIAPRVIWTYGSKPDQPRDAEGRFAPSNRTYGPIRRLFGPSPSKELAQDQSLETFQRVAPAMLIEKVAPRIAKLMTF